MQKCLLERKRSYLTEKGLFSRKAACYAQMGRLDEAKETVKRLRTLTNSVVPSATHWRNAEDRELFLSGLRLAAGEPTPLPP